MEVGKFVHERLIDPSLGLGNPVAGDLLGDIWSKRDRIEGYLWLVVGKSGAYRIKCRWAIEDYLSGEVEQAELHLMRAKWDLNEWALAHYLLGIMYLGQGRYHESLIELEQSQRFEPYDKGRIQSAIELVQQTAAEQQNT